MASVEKRFVEHNRRMVGLAARTTGTTSIRSAAARRAGPGAAEAETKAVARSFDQIGKAARAADARTYREKARLEKDHQRQALRGIAEIGRAARQEEMRVHRERTRVAAASHREFRSRTSGVVGAGISSVGGMGASALGVVGIAGGAMIASKVGPAVGLDKQQRALLTAGHGAGEKSPYTLDQIQKITNETAIKTGNSQESVVAGMREYVSATGDLRGAAAAIESFGVIATAAEANIADVAKAGAYLSTAMGVTAKEMPEALASFYFQGKKGAFELKDIASAIPELGTMAESMGMKGLQGAKNVGGLAQIAMKGTGNSAEAQTALANLLRQSVAKSDKLQSGEMFGGRKVQVFNSGDPTKGFKNYNQTLADMVVASRGNIQQLNDFAEIRGSKALNPLVNAYAGAVSGLGPNATQKEKDQAGGKAVLAMIEDASNARGAFRDVQADAADAMQSFSSQMEALNVGLVSAVQKDLLPTLVRMIPQLQKLVPQFAKLVEVIAKAIDTFAANPLGNIGEIIATKVAFDIAAAAIGPRIRDALTNALVGGGVGGTGGGASGAGAAGGFMAGGVLANALAAVTIATLAVQTFRAGTLLIDNFMPSNKKEVEDDIGRFNRETEAVHGGGDLKTRIAELEKLREESQGRLSAPFESADPVMRIFQMLGADASNKESNPALFSEKLDRDLKASEEVSRYGKEIIVLLQQLKAVESGPNRGNAPSPVKS